ncbi:MAG: hypothetical protein U0930_06315 [Pirellulales bacterium]
MAVFAIGLWGLLVSSLVVAQANDKLVRSDPLTVSEAQKIAANHQSLKSFVVLDNLKVLGVESAAALAQCKGQLSLKGLVEITPEVAEALAAHEGELALDGVTSLTEEAAVKLGANVGVLSLNQLKPTAKILRALSKQNGLLRLNGIESLSSVETEALSQHHGTLELNGLKSLTSESAGLLVASKSNLSLNGIPELTPEVQHILGRHSKSLSLDRLKVLSEVTLAQKLANQETSIDLGMLDETNLDCLKALVNRRFGLSLGLKQLSIEQARILSTHNVSLSLPRVRRVSDEVVGEILKTKAKISMPGLEEISNPALARLLVIQNASVLYFPNMKQLSLEIARELAKADTNLVLSGLVEISDEVVTELSAHLRTLNLGQITTLSDKAAKSLAEHKGKIHMKSLRDISPESLELLEGKLVR